MRVLHILDHSLPYLSAYSFRTSYILLQQRALGMKPVVLTAPSHESPENSCELHQAVNHYRTRWPEFYFLPQPRFVPILRHKAYISALRNRIIEVARDCNAELIHAHSPAGNGIAAALAAKTLRLPWVYELRYYEQDAAVDSGRSRYDSWRYQWARWREERVIRSSDMTITNSVSMRNELIGRGLGSHRLVEVPEGVDARIFSPQEPDAELISRHQLNRRTVIGFIGSFYRYEGLERLVEATIRLLRERRDVALVLAGAGEMEGQLRARVPKEWADHFIFTGKIEQEDILRYYSIMDICVYPRHSTRMTELTTSIRPLEAMAMERAVIGSNVGGIAELIKPNKTGLVVECDDMLRLSAAIAYLINNPIARREMGKRARAHILKQRDWTQIGRQYAEVYSRISPQRPQNQLSTRMEPDPMTSTYADVNE